MGVGGQSRTAYGAGHSRCWAHRVFEKVPPPEDGQEKCVKAEDSVKATIIGILGITRKRSENTSCRIKLVN